jgi:hypothetical protein
MTSIAFRHLNDWSRTAHVLATAGVGTGPSSQASMPTEVKPATGALQAETGVWPNKLSRQRWRIARGHPLSSA